MIAGLPSCNQNPTGSSDEESITTSSQVAESSQVNSGESTLESVSSVEESLSTSTVTDIMLDNERKYSGEVINGNVPHGQGVLTWIYTNCVYTGEFKYGKYDGQGLFEWRNDKNKFEGEFRNNEPYYGKFTYENTMSYTGYMSNWQFHGQGAFDWNTYFSDGTVKAYGWLYEGEFKNGTMAGCRGKVTFTCARDGKNSDGFYWFEGLMDGFPNVKKGQQGKGKLVFGDKSFYEGDIYYDQAGVPQRFGKGIQYFYKGDNFSAGNIGGNLNDKIYAYEGQFDTIDHQYIYGNGIYYISNQANEPVGYMKGEWDVFNRIAAWQGEFDESLIWDDYKGLNEIPYEDGYYSLLKQFIARDAQADISGKTILVGASHFTFWGEGAKTALAPTLDAINYGIGGSTADFWNSHMDEWDAMTNGPKNILICVGGNDIAIHTTPATAFSYLKGMIDGFASRYPNTNVVYLSSFDSPVKWGTWQVEDLRTMNGLVESYINGLSNNKIHYADITSMVYGDSVTDYHDNNKGYLQTRYYVEDMLHFNSVGYTKFKEAILGVAQQYGL